MTALELVNVTKRFGGLVVANNVSLALQEGEVCALIGPNGAGKTTLVNLITGRLRADSGEIRLRGEDILRFPPQQRVRSGLVRTFQITTLFAGFTVWENIALAVAERRGLGLAMFPGRGFPDVVVEEAETISQQVRLNDVGNSITRELAYGQQRVLEIALALALKPTVLLLDEPAAGLPSSEHFLIIDVIRRLPADVAVLLIEHDMDLVFSLSQKITVLVEGAVLVSGAPDEIRRDSGVKSAYLGDLHNV